MSKLAVEMTNSLVHERLQATSTSNDSVMSEPFFDVAEKIVDIVLSAICETGLNTRYHQKKRKSALREFVLLGESY